MATFNFHESIDRSNTNSYKWDYTKQIFGYEDVLPMWVADMDFNPPHEVIQAIQKRVDHGIFGYSFVPTSAAEAISAWMKKRHQWEIETSWVVYHSGVVPAISTAIRALTNPKDKIMVQSPVYTPFFTMIEKNDREVVNVQLNLVNNRYAIDFHQVEEELKKGVKMFLLCSPHNPGGRIWTELELRQLADLCQKYKCLILSDEIHSDLIYKPNRHIPIVSLEKQYEDFIITCIAPSKTFNIAGLQSSALIIPSKKLRTAIKLEQMKQGFSGLNAFGSIALEASYRYGETWLEELLQYLKENINIAKCFLNDYLPNITLIEPDGTYLLWLDCRKLGLTDDELKQELLQKGKLALEPGPKYGPGGEGFVRMNIACSRDTLLDGLERLKQAFS